MINGVNTLIREDKEL